MSAKTIEGKINNTWKRICDENDIPKYVRRSFVSSNTDLPIFYHLIKTHKPPEQGLKIRPIISNVNGPTTKISWLLARLLKPLLHQVPAHLENSLQLINAIQSRSIDDNKEFPYPFSLDVVALYTSIPVQEAINNVSNKLGTSINHFTNHNIVDLLTAVTQNVYFTFDAQIFKQKEGLPMGSSVSGILAILFMDTLERQTLTSCTYISQYGRYVDDIYAQTIDEQHADEFHVLMKSQHVNIDFEIEKPTKNAQGYSLSLLDFNVCVNRDGTTSFDFYKKKAKKPLFVHYQSWLPETSKFNFVRNERERIRERCTSPDVALKRDQEFDVVLTTNGYPERFINKSKTNVTEKRRERRNSNNGNSAAHEDWLYLSIPYVSDHLDNKLKKIFRSENLKVRISHKSHNIRNALKKPTERYTCKIDNCPLKESRKCFVKGCVYEITCSACGSKYIGSTIRHLHERIREHLSTSKSSVFIHVNACSPITREIKVDVIIKDGDPANLRLLEALYIKNINPSINSRDECSELQDLLF